MNLKKGEIYYFDLETGGLSPYESPLVSGSFASARNITGAKETFFKPALPTKFGRRIRTISLNEFESRMSPFSAKMLKTEWKEWYTANKVSPTSFFGNMVDVLSKESKNKPVIVVAHNAKFDWRFAEQYMSPKKVTQLISAVPEEFRTPAMKFALDKGGEVSRVKPIIGTLPTDVWRDASSARRAVDIDERINRMVRAGINYTDRLSNFVERGRRGLVIADSLFIGETGMALAQKLGYMEKTGDFTTGLKLTVFKGLRGIKNNVSHVAAEDISVTHEFTSYMMSLTQKMRDELLTGKSSLSDYDRSFLQAMGYVQQKYSPIAIKRNIVQARIELEKTGRFALQWGYRGKEQIYGTSLDDFLNESSEVYKRYSARAKKLGVNFEDIVNEVKNAPDISTFEREADKQLDNIVQEAREGFLSGKKGFAKAEEAAESVVEKATRSGVTSKGNLLAWGALAAVGATFVYMGYSRARDPENSMDKQHGRASDAIHGMHEKGISAHIRKMMTEFGSGYKGPNPWLNPEYNRAEDEPRYKVMRASQAGHSYEDVLQYMLEKRDASEFAEASASAGTALHEYMERKLLITGKAKEVEQFVYDRYHNITGHIDVVTNDDAVEDIKTLNAGRFYTMLRNRKPYPAHVAQVNFYMGATGRDRGQIRYINREDPSRSKIFRFNFDPYLFEQTVQKVEKAREQVKELIASGAIDESELPKTASVERLVEYQEDNPPPTKDTITKEDMDKWYRIFQEEMEYLHSVKRGMPKQGPAKDRIDQANKKRLQEIDYRTSGIGLQMYKDANRSRQFQ